MVPRTVWYWDDATWILAASFIIFTMQTGFGMLESGIVSLKNQESDPVDEKDEYLKLEGT